jgi:hypothetical protein
VIDRSGPWWTGTNATDVDEYLRSYTEEGYPATRFEQSRCTCGSHVFRLEADDVEGCARRTCAECGLPRFICDSNEIAGDATLAAITCPCEASEFELVVGFSHREDGNIRWISVGARCVRCGALGCPVEWEIDYAPTAQLYELV